MELKRVDTALLKMLYLVVAGIVVSQVLGLDSISSALFLLTFPLTMVLWVRTIRVKLESLDLLVLLIAVLATISVLVNALITETIIGFSYIKKLIMFIMSLLFFQSVNKLRADKNVVRYIHRVTDLLTLFMIVMYFLRNSQMYLLNGTKSPYLTFGFTNPNLTGMFLTCLYMLETYRLFTKEKGWVKIAHVIMAIFLAWFTLGTRSRNCLLVIVMYTAVCAWLIFRGQREMRVGKLTAVAVAVLPMVFALVYLMVVNSDWLGRAFAFLIGEGKMLDSRVAIWRNAFEKLNHSPFIGDYSGISDGTGVSQLHNTHVDIAVSYGTCILVLVCVFLCKIFYQSGKVYKEKQNYIYIWGFACAIMLGVGEAALFAGGMAIYVLAGILLLLSKQEIEVKNHEIRVSE